MTCSVLRCTDDAVDVVDVGCGYRVEAPVCAMHREALAAGAEWDWDGEERALLLGDDLAVSQGSLLAGFTTSTPKLTHGVGLGEAERITRITLKLKRAGQDDIEEIVFTVDGRTADSLRRMVRFLPKGADDIWAKPQEPKD